MPRKKSFIDKKTAVSFHLVHGGGEEEPGDRPPLAAGDAPATAPSRHILPLRHQPATQGARKEAEVEKRREEQRRYGIFFDDNYDYLQHLKEMVVVHTFDSPSTPSTRQDDGEEEGAATLAVSSSAAFASGFEEDEVGWAWGRPNEAVTLSGSPGSDDVDPDVIAPLDDDFDLDDFGTLDDDFIAKASDVAV